MGVGYLVVEGHGERAAAQNLVVRLWMDLDLPAIHWAEPIRMRSLHRQQDLDRVCNLIRSKTDPAALLILRDEDDACPKETAPQFAEVLRRSGLPFPSAMVLLHREYEVLFLPCAALMAGRPLTGASGIARPGLADGVKFDGNPEDVRGVKEWLSRHFARNKSYKPTLDQLPMTRMLDFDLIRRAGNVPCFFSLERALRFLSEHLGQSAVYPPSAQEILAP